MIRSQNKYFTTEQLNLFILNGQPYIYRRGVFKRNEAGKILKAYIKAKDEHISMATLIKICETLNCDITDVVMLVPDDKP